MVKLLIKRILHRRSFYISLLIGCIISLLYIAIDVFPYRMYDGTPYKMWIETYSMSQSQRIFFLVMPILAAMALGDMLYSDKESGYLDLIITKGKGKEYFQGLFISNFVVGGLCVLIPLLLNLYCCFMLLPNRGPDMATDAAVNVTFDRPITLFPELYYSHPLLHIAIYLVIDFVIGAMYASMALCAGFFLNNRFFITLFPFVVSYLFTMLALHGESMRNYIPERFAQQLGGCTSLGAVVCVLGIGIAVTIVVYITSVKKRVIT